MAPLQSLTDEEEAQRVPAGTDCTRVPMLAREVEGAAGKQENGTAEILKAKAIACFTLGSRDPKIGEPRKPMRCRIQKENA